MKTKTGLTGRLVCILMAILLVFSITACTSSAEKTEEQASVTGAEATETTKETETKTDESSDGSSDDPSDDSLDDSLFDPDGKGLSDSPKASDAEAVPYLEIDNKSVLEDKEKSGDTIIYTGSFESPILSDASALTYPELAAALEKRADDAYAVYQDDRKTIVDEALDRYKDDPDFFKYGGYENYNYAWLRRADDKVVSYMSYFSKYEGGAHGYSAQNGYTIDTETGKRLGLKDVIKDTSKLNDILEKEIIASYGDENFDDLKERLAQFDPNITESADDDSVYPYEWCLLPVGIEFYFAPYSLAYYAAGAQDVLLTYEDYPDLFVDEYKAEKDQGFVYEFLGYTDIFDITGDGKKDSLWVEAENTDKYNFADGISITLNGDKKITKDVSFYNKGGSTRLATYIYMPDGRQYIYTEAMVDDIDDEMFVFDLNKGRVKYVDFTDTHGDDIIKWDNDFFYYRMPGTDPDKMDLFREINILATFLATAPHHVGKNGIPEADEPFKPVELPAEWTLTSKIELTCDIVDEDGKVISEKEKIKAGEKFEIFSTDGETYVDARMSDGRIARLNVTSTKYPCEIDGISAEDCFEELFYAG